MPDLKIHQYEVSGSLGRHLVLDPRSLAYRRRYTGDPIHPVEWAPKVPVLDQRNLIEQGIHTSDLYDGVHDMDALASCTGNAATYLVSVLHDANRLSGAGLDVTDPAAAQLWAIGVYSSATRCDRWHECTWPAEDCGSSGLGVAKALRERGLADQYGHATSAEELGQLLQTGPVLMGLPWYSAFSEPGPYGFIDADPMWASSPLEGGHEVCLTALEDVTTNPDGTIADTVVLRFVNSWGSGWSEQGYGRLTLRTYRSLRHEIDLVQPRLESSR